MESRPWLYLRIWVDSWQKKWRNPFHKCASELTAGSQSWLQDCTSAWSTEFVFLVPFSTSNHTGTQDQTSYWRNKSHARIILRAYPRTSWPSLPPSFQISRVLYMATIGDNLQRPTTSSYRHGERWREISPWKAENLAYKAGIRWKLDRNQEAKRDRHTL